jgi:hypothetical protein
MDRSTTEPSLEVVTMPPMPDSAAIHRMGPSWSSIGDPTCAPVNVFHSRSLWGMSREDEWRRGRTKERAGT